MALTGSESSEVDDPEVSLFFKDFKNAPKERRDEMLRFWNFIKEQQIPETGQSAITVLAAI